MIPRACLPAVALLALAGPARGGTPYHNTDYNFRLDLPDGWTPFTDTELAAANARAPAVADNREVRYVAGFRPTSSGPGRLPYLLVQVFPGTTTGQTFDEIAAVMERLAPQGVGEAGAALTGRVTEVMRDREAHRVTVSLTVTGPGGPVAECRAVCRVGGFACVCVHAYATPDTYPLWRGTFADAQNTLRFDAGREYSGDDGLDGWVGESEAAVLRGVGVGGGIGLAAGLVLFLRRPSRRSAKAAGPPPPRPRF